MNRPDLLLHDNPAVDLLMPASNDINEIIQPIAANIAGADQLSMAGVDNIVEAIGAGHSIKAICHQLGISIKAFRHWQAKLSAEDRGAIDDAKILWLESLETICQTKMLSIAKIHEDLDEGDETTRERLDMRNRAMQNLEKIIKSVQTTLSRLQAQQALRDNTEAEVHITQMIVSNEWLAALPEE